VLSEGRVELGLGRGTNPAHFAGYRVAMSEARARLIEGIELLQRAFVDDVFSFDGRFFQASDVRLVPKPVQRPQPPIRLAANSPDTVALAGRLGLPIIVAAHVNHFAKLRDLIDTYRAARRDGGFPDATPDDLSVLMPLYVGESEGQIARDVAPSVKRYVHVLSSAAVALLDKCGSQAERDKLEAQLTQIRATTFETVNGKLGIFDTPRGCTEQLRWLGSELGIGRVIAWFNMGGLVSHEHVMRSMELFANEVMPGFGLAAAA
jgi:alkanesulfonate monooxygenase SsuD/methylene tetrahydromethanopterin reductase-like flavin-dependent oxidoreductase (luciferase family)